MGNQRRLKMKSDLIRFFIYKAITGKKLKIFCFSYTKALSQKEVIASKSFKSFLCVKEKNLGYAAN